MDGGVILNLFRIVWQMCYGDEKSAGKQCIKAMKEGVWRPIKDGHHNVPPPPTAPEPKVFGGMPTWVYIAMLLGLVGVVLLSILQ
jgi:hypothetical protein